MGNCNPGTFKHDWLSKRGPPTDRLSNISKMTGQFYYHFVGRILIDLDQCCRYADMLFFFVPLLVDRYFLLFVIVVRVVNYETCLFVVFFFFHFKVVRFLRCVFLIRLCPTRGNGKLMRMAIGQPLNHCCARLKRHRPGIQIPRTEPQPRRQLASNLRNPATNQEQTIKIAQTEHWHVPSILNSRTKCTVQAILNIQHGYLNPFRKWY